AEIGEHCIINSGAVIEHDCKLGNFVHISPKAALAGDVKVGEGTHVGIGAMVIPGINIGKWVTIGAGAVVLKDIPDGVTTVGNPARIIKEKTIYHMQKSKIWLSSPHMGGTEMKYIQDAFDKNWIAPLGPNVEGFEKDIQEYLSQNPTLIGGEGDINVAALSSGTAALH